ncbi:hypothetical protein MYU51_001305 [Penicillium brevicompactum]
MHCLSPQPIKDTSFELAGPIVRATRSPPQQPTELTHCTARVCIPKKKLEYPRRRYVNLSLTCLNSVDPEDDAIPIEPRTFDLNARGQGPQLFAVSLPLVLATRALDIDIAPEVPEDTAPPCGHPIASFAAQKLETSIIHGNTTVCLGIQTPRKNRFLLDRIPDVQWVNLIVLGWHLASFQSWNSKRPRNAGGFVHSPAFWKRRPESAMNQNTTWLEWCCIALPKRIRTKRALCELCEQARATMGLYYRASAFEHRERTASLWIKFLMSNG